MYGVSHGKTKDDPSRKCRSSKESLLASKQNYDSTFSLTSTEGRGSRKEYRRDVRWTWEIPKESRASNDFLRDTSEKSSKTNKKKYIYIYERSENEIEGKKEGKDNLRHPIVNVKVCDVTINLA